MTLVAVGVMVMTCMCGCLISPVMHFGGGKSAREAQQEQYERVTPASFARHHKWAGDVSTAKIRVWADDAYRAQNLHWQQTFQDELDAANEVLTATFGVRLVADYRVWQRHAPGASLEDSLDALAQVDTGDAVLSVVGLTSSISLVSATFEQLGLASVGGRHMVIRGYADVEERKRFEAAFTELRAEERDLLYPSRRRHKTTAILLHELGHNLGAEHVPDEDTLMHAVYSERSSAFDPHSHEVILAALDQRLHRGRGGAPAAEPATPVAPTPVAASGIHPKLVVSIDDAGQHIVGGHALDGATLDGLFRLCFTDDPDTEIVVKAAKRAPRAAVVDLFDRAKAVGLQRFSVAAPRGRARPEILEADDATAP
jgi:predicted Zn-dependent protease